MNKIWSITIECHECPNRLIDDGYSFCTVANGPKYCNMEDCPIKKPLNKAVEHGQAGTVCGKECPSYGAEECDQFCPSYPPAG